jgi:Na+-transporting methylmalonyl-CoA/oxaloacetate decarboxylase gamma subunit
MEFMTEYNIVGFIVIFLLLIVLGMQIQMSIIGRRIEEKEEYISEKIEELLKKKISQLLSNK